MGNGSQLPRALILLLAAALTGGCYDFHDPMFPASGAPVTLQANIWLTEDRGLSFYGYLTPGINADGFTRTVEADAIVLMGSSIAPIRVRDEQLHEYADSMQLSDRIGKQPITLVSPRVKGIQAPTPAIQWFVPERLDPDTITIEAGADLILRVQPEAGMSLPLPQIRQWSVHVAGDSTVFTAGANGIVPAEIRVPAYWLPAADSAGRLRAVLIVYMASHQRPEPGDYMANINLDTRLTWHIRIRR